MSVSRVSIDSMTLNLTDEMRERFKEAGFGFVYGPGTSGPLPPEKEKEMVEFAIENAGECIVRLREEEAGKDVNIIVPLDRSIEVIVGECDSIIYLNRGFSTIERMASILGMDMAVEILNLSSKRELMVEYF